MIEKKLILNMKKKNWKFFCKLSEHQWFWLSWKLDIFIDNNLVPQLKLFLIYFHHKIAWGQWAFATQKRKCELIKFFKIQNQTNVALACEDNCTKYCRMNKLLTSCPLLLYFHYKIQEITLIESSHRKYYNLYEGNNWYGMAVSSLGPTP